jgi:hypothetical protein
MTNALDKMLEERRRRDADMREAYSEIYKDFTGHEGTIEVTVGEMPFGKPFYTFQTTTEWIGVNVLLVGEMEMFNKEEGVYKRIGNDAGNIEITSENIDLVRQRSVDFSRAAGIAKYLLLHPFHNLPDLVLVVTEPWVENPDAQQWEGGRALRDSVDIEMISDDIDKALIRLGKAGQADRSSLYALDGQHRLIGIRAALTMLKNGTLTLQKEDGSMATGRSSVERLEEWLDEVEDFGITKLDALRFRNERVGIKLVPAVCKGETWEEAIQRLASIFKAFNTTSVAVSKGAAAAMDMEDGFAIVARRTYKASEFLKDKKDVHNNETRPTRLSPNNNTIASKSTVVTTLATLKSMAEEYFRNGGPVNDWYKPTKKKLMGQPPTEAMISAATEEFLAFWDQISTLPSMRDIEPWKFLPEDVRKVTEFRAPRNVAEMRRFPTATLPGEAQMLFRPLGQQALAMAVGALVHRQQNPMSLEQIFEILRRFDARNGFCLVDPKYPWWGVLYDQTKGKIVTGGTKLAGELLQYMLSGSTTNPDLKRAFANARRSSKPDLYVDLEGQEVSYDNFRLPARLE